MSTETSFTESQFDNYYPEGINNFYWNDARNKIIFKTIKDLQLYDPIVEIGCGRGPVVEFLRSKHILIKGYEIANIQPYDSVKDIVECNTDAVNVPHAEASRFKTMLLLDVVEHIEDPVAFINALLDRFKNVEQLLITVPACNEIFSNYDTSCGHFLRYDFDSAKSLADQLNLHINHMSYFFKGLYPPARILKSIKKDRNTTIIPPVGELQKIFHRMISLYFQVEYHLFPAQVKGSSLLLVLRRK